MKKCQKYKKRLILYVFEEMTEKEQKEIENHLSVCEQCRLQVHDCKYSLSWYQSREKVIPPQLQMLTASETSIVYSAKKLFSRKTARLGLALVLLAITFVTTLYFLKEKNNQYWSIEIGWEAPYSPELKHMQQIIKDMKQDRFFD